MKKQYPVIFTPAAEGGFTVYVPGFEINTQGDTMAESIENARDAIAIIGIDMEDDGKIFPEPATDVQHESGEIVSYVYVDLTEYRMFNQK